MYSAPPSSGGANNFHRGDQAETAIHFGPAQKYVAIGQLATISGHSLLTLLTKATVTAIWLTSTPLG